MFDVGMYYLLTAVIVAAILVRVIILRREVLVARAIVNGTLYGAGRFFPSTYRPIRGTAAFLAERSESACIELVGRMFLIPVGAGRRTTALWSIWQRAHVPSYALCARKTHPAKQRVLLRSIMTGLKNAVAASVALRRTSSRDDTASSSAITDEGVLDFDEFWPVVECVEQLAVHVHPDNEQEFSSGVARLAAVGDVTAQVQLAWVVNELLERSAEEQSLGRAVAVALGSERGARHARAALRTLAAYKRTKGGSEAGTAESIDKIDTFFLQKEKPFLDESSAFVRRVLIEQREPVEQAIRVVTNHLFLSGDLSDPAVEGAAIAIGKACDQLISTGTQRSGLRGIAALAAVRLTLRNLCHDLEYRTAGLADNAPMRVAASGLAQNVCRWLMEGFGQGRVSGFIVVESMESIRDHRASDAAEAMVTFLRGGPSPLDPGIAVCVAEGIEDGLYNDEPNDTKEERDRKNARRNELLADARFEPSRRGWTSPASRGKSSGLEQNADEVSGDKFNDVRRFWQTSLPLFVGRQRQDIPTWMNLRLALRRARPRRFLLGVVVK